MTRRTAIIAGAALLLGAGVAIAHEGHAHTIVGTVASLKDAKLDVKTADGKTATVGVNEKTVVLRGKDKLTLRDVTAGQRVVVDVGTGKAPLVAREIKVGVAKPIDGVAVGSAKRDH